jgi:metallo-beta-lactamase family protein
MHLKFCGAARTVTGSCHLLTLDDGYKILLDCGLYQGNEGGMREFNRDWLFEPSEVDVVVLSHAHIDHSGRLPMLVRDGFRGDILCTHPTKDLCSVMLMDSAYLQERDAEFENKQHYRKEGHKLEALYTMDDVAPCLDRFVTIGYNRWFTLRPGLEVRLLDAGHILGSASVTLRIQRNGEEPLLFGFTADIGRPNRPILKDPVPMPPMDYLICESTYGGEKHESAPDELEHFLDIIKSTCVERKGKLLIPAFSVGRTQEIVYMLDRLENEGRLPRIKVYVDSPMAVDATSIYSAHPECFDKDIREYMQHDPNPFGFHNLMYIRRLEDSKMLNTLEGPAIIISASGMMEGGRIRHHVFNQIDKPDNTVLFVGFCAPQTLGARIRDGAKTVRLFGQEKEVRARIEIMDSFSAHGDEQEMVDFLVLQNKKRLKHIWLAHGEYDRQQAFRDRLLDEGFRKVDIPGLGQEVQWG